MTKKNKYFNLYNLFCFSCQYWTMGFFLFLFLHTVVLKYVQIISIITIISKNLSFSRVIYEHLDAQNLQVLFCWETSGKQPFSIYLKLMNINQDIYSYQYPPEKMRNLSNKIKDLVSHKAKY